MAPMCQLSTNGCAGSRTCQAARTNGIEQLVHQRRLERAIVGLARLVDLPRDLLELEPGLVAWAGRPLRALQRRRLSVWQVNENSAD